MFQSLHSMLSHCALRCTAWWSALRPFVLSPQFLLVFLSWFFSNFAFLYPYTYVIAMAQLQGLSSGPWMLVAMGLGDLCLRLPLSWPSDRMPLGAVRVTIAYTFLLALVSAAFALGPQLGSVGLFCCAVLYGALSGAWMTLAVPLVAEYFRHAQLSGLMGLLNFSAAFGALLGLSLIHI